MTLLGWVFGKQQHHLAQQQAGSTESVRRIGQKLRRLPKDRARYLAAFAYLLGRVANADLKFEKSEIERMERLVASTGGVGEEEAALVVQMAVERNRLFGGTENFLVAREFSEVAGGEQKTELIRCLYAVAAADGTISAVEDGEIARIASEIGVDQATLASIRAENSALLAVLKRDW